MTSSSSHLFVIRDEPADWTDLVLRTWLSERNTTISTSTTPAGEPRTLQQVEPGVTPSTPTGVKKHYKGAKGLYHLSFRTFYPSFNQLTKLLALTN